ncbi:MAG: phosphopantetheine-binding protein [Acidobacteriota bacterium]|nr:phosphopantetheine-binding protein [Acidobacteriota bacterium]
MSDQVLEGVKRIVAEDLDLNLAYEDIDVTMPLFEEGLALDSVVLVELISFIEERFKIELRDDALNMETFKNLESVARLIREQLAEQQQR